MAGLTLDTGALIAAERDHRVFWAHWGRAGSSRDVTVPSVVVAQAWRGGRGARMATVINAATVEPLTLAIARSAGELLGRARSADAIDAVVVVSAASRGDAILTSDPDDLRRLAGYLAQGLQVLLI